MKRITLRAGGKVFNSVDVFKQVAEHSPQRPFTIEEMRKRVKLLDAIDAATGDTLVVEDAEHELLKKALQEFPWNRADRELLKIIEDGIEARDVSTAALKAVDAG